MIRFNFARLCVRWFAASLLIMAASARAAEGGFTATLSADKQLAAGLTALTTAERAALDQFVAAELALARSDGKPEFTGTFVSRRSEAERKAAGLDRLTTAQLEKLNEWVAAVLNRPQPKERPRLKASDVLSAARENRIHGSVTVAYGWGHGGRDMWAESLWLEYYDPERRFSLGIGLSNYDGDGFFGGYPDYYGFYPDYFGFYPDYYSAGYGNRYYSRLPVFIGSPAYDTGGRRGDFSYGEGMMLRGDAGGPSIGRGDRRGR
ncbi:MAG: hypothetical protein PSV13_15595 [Lacunisphaera sp.]|nr:hypothetical protein [Lacunisphaera sp.]